MIFLLIFISSVLGVGAWLLFLWAARSDQFDDVEGAKHRTLNEDRDDDASPAGRGATAILPFEE